MFNPKISGIVAGAAFVLSFLTGLFTGSPFFPVLLRAFILGIIAFVLSALVYWLVSQFLPDLLTTHQPNEADEIDIPGSKVDISIDSSGDDDDLTPMNSSVPRSEDSALEDADGISAQGLDQRAQDAYNKMGEGDIPQSSDNLSGNTALPEKDASESAIDVLPDLETMSASFSPSDDSEEESETPEMEEDFSSAPPPPVSEPLRARKHSDPGDFNTQELASAIQTILRRDEKV